MPKEQSDLLAIDLDRLDREWAGQPRLAYHWNDRLAEAKYQLKKAEDRLALVEAQVKLGLYQTPSDYGLDGPPKNKEVADAAVTSSEKYQAAALAVRAAFKEVEHLKAFCIGVDHRRHALEDEVRLLGMDYRSEPKVRDTGENGEAFRRRASAAAERSATRPYRRSK